MVSGFVVKPFLADVKLTKDNAGMLSALVLCTDEVVSSISSPPCVSNSMSSISLESTAIFADGGKSTVASPDLARLT